MGQIIRLFQQFQDYKSLLAHDYCREEIKVKRHGNKRHKNKWLEKQCTEKNKV